MRAGKYERKLSLAGLKERTPVNVAGLVAFHLQMAEQLSMHTIMTMIVRQTSNGYAQHAIAKKPRFRL